jgi:4-hydroxy-tetrahydrodipicolinate synthase
VTADVVSAVPIPFSADGALDVPEYEALLHRVSAHVDGALIAGTTGEFPALDDDERLLAFRVAFDVLGVEGTIAHLGHASTRQVLRLADSAASLGITRFALLSPYYLPTDDDGVVEFFRAVTERHPGASLYAYLFPERTGMDVSVETLRRVMQLPGMRGVKLSGGAAAASTQYATALGDGQELYSGDDSKLIEMVAAGGAGVVSGVSAVFPKTFAQLAKAIRSGDDETAAAVASDVNALVSLTGVSITRLKAALAVRTGGDWAHRMALPSVDPSTLTRIREAVANFE